LHKEKSWAKVIKAKAILQSKLREEKILGLKTDESELKSSKFAAEIEILRKEELEKKVFMDESVSEELGVREHYEMKKENIRKKELKSKYIEKDIKETNQSRETIVCEMNILQEMLKKFSSNSLNVEAIERRIKLHKTKERNVEIKKDNIELEREKIDKDVFTNQSNLKTKCYEILSHKNTLQQLFKDHEEIVEIQSTKDVLAVYPRASQVQQAIESNQSSFIKRPLGPVGRYIRVKTNDSNITILIETEIGHKILSS
jgi:hypothetical protein